MYTSRQINTIPENPLPVFNAIFFCLPVQAEQMESELGRCYDKVNTAYWHNKQYPIPGTYSVMNRYR